MKPSESNKPSNDNDRSKDLSVEAFDRRASELTELLKACRHLSDILNPDELYATFAGIIRNKFGISRLGLFVYDPEKETFELVFSYGLGKLNFKFKRGRKKLWETILMDKPFAVVDQSGDPLFPKFLEKQDLKILPSRLWAPLVMRGEVIGLLTMGPKPGEQPFDVTSITDVHARYIKEGRIKLDKSRFKGGITYHDPCQIARNGGIFDEPRYILQHLTDDFREMSPEPTYNWCCGGGGGLVALGEETLDFRMKSSKVKVDQVNATGAKILTTACENCHTQLSNLNDHYKMGLEVKFLSSIVADALMQ